MAGDEWREVRGNRRIYRASVPGYGCGEPCNECGADPSASSLRARRAAKKNRLPGCVSGDTRAYSKAVALPFRYPNQANSCRGGNAGANFSYCGSRGQSPGTRHMVTATVVTSKNLNKEQNAA